jgi:thiamine pyrophosphokinase
MNLPERLSNAQSWTVIGPMGPQLSHDLTAHPILAVDGGASFTSKIDVWTGDQDSLKTNLVCAHQLLLKPNKDFSDLASAFQILSKTKGEIFHLWGFLGGRLDHELFNIGEALRFISQRPGQKISFYNYDGKIQVQVFGQGIHQFTRAGTFSVATLAKTKFKLTGQCRYQITEFTEISPLSSFGLSNHGDGLMTLESSDPVFVLFPEFT